MTPEQETVLASIRRLTGDGQPTDAHAIAADTQLAIDHVGSSVAWLADHLHIDARPTAAGDWTDITLR